MWGPPLWAPGGSRDRKATAMGWKLLFEDRWNFSVMCHVGFLPGLQTPALYLWVPVGSLGSKLRAAEGMGGGGQVRWKGNRG